MSSSLTEDEIMKMAFDIPMLVIFLGPIGGMIFSGLLGLFVGTIGLAFSYKLFMVRLEEDTMQEQDKV
jgi:predicted PurR-regulated permease PerM